MAAAAPTQTPAAQIARIYQRATFKELGSQTFAPGGSDIDFTLKQQGYTDLLLVQIKGSYALADSCTPALVQGSHDIVKKFLVDVPGRETPINLSGRMLRIANLRGNDFGIFPISGLPASVTGEEANSVYDAARDDFPITVNTTNDFVVNYVVPFHRSVVDHSGNLPTGALDKIHLMITPATSFADFMTTAHGVDHDVSDISATVSVTQVIFSAPPSDALVIPGTTGDGIVIKYDETTDVIPQAGVATKIPIVAEDVLLAIAHAVTIAGVRDSADVDSVYLRVEESYFTDPNGQPADRKTVLDALANGAPFPEGVFMWDRDTPAAGQGDWIFTDGINDIEVGLTVKSGISLGTPNNSNVRTLRMRRIVLPAGA